MEEVLVVFNSGTSSFLSPDSSISPRGIAITDNFLHIIGQDHSFTSKGFLIQTLKDSIDSSSKLGIAASSLFIVHSGFYDITISPPGSVTFGNLPPFTLGTLPTVSTLVYVETVSSAQTVSYFLETQNYTDLKTDTKYLESISLTCSIGGVDSITYTIVDNGADTAPTWVQLKELQESLEISTPNMTTTQTFSFAIKATVAGNNYLKIIYLTVSPGTSQSSNSSNSSNLFLGYKDTEIASIVFLIAFIIS
mmetsp:Transcript_19043/g.16879  ORF Transcript_19043/g.16879 Transcript_19043/m.16879 type:complete len:250 (+) Transcript_19043:146-895(+)